MRPSVFASSCVALALLSSLTAGRALAAPAPSQAQARSQAGADDEDGDDEAKKVGPKLPEDPSGKLYEKFEMERGFYIASDIGVFMTFGGASRAVSSLEPYLGINMGYDINSWFSWQIHAGRGFASNAARTANQIGRIDNFAITNFLTGPVVWILVWERLAIELKAQGGLSLLDPVPFDPNLDGITMPAVQPTVGGGLALKYLTLLTDFTLGVDVTFNFAVTAKIPQLSISPTVRYTF